MGTYKGAVVFVAGVHYPVNKDGDADTSRPLRADGTGYRDAEKGETLHNDTHHSADLDLEVGGED